MRCAGCHLLPSPLPGVRGGQLPAPTRKPQCEQASRHGCPRGTAWWKMAHRTNGETAAASATIRPSRPRRDSVPGRSAALRGSADIVHQPADGRILWETEAGSRAALMDAVRIGALAAEIWRWRLESGEFFDGAAHPAGKASTLHLTMRP